MALAILVNLSLGRSCFDEISEGQALEVQRVSSGLEVKRVS